MFEKGQDRAPAPYYIEWVDTVDKDRPRFSFTYTTVGFVHGLAVFSTEKKANEFVNLNGSAAWPRCTSSIVGPDLFDRINEIGTYIGTLRPFFMFGSSRGFPNSLRLPVFVDPVDWNTEFQDNDFDTITEWAAVTYATV
jgi:hypothetical protein